MVEGKECGGGRRGQEPQWYFALLGFVSGKSLLRTGPSASGKTISCGEEGVCKTRDSSCTQSSASSLPMKHNHIVTLRSVSSSCIAPSLGDPLPPH